MKTLRLLCALLLLMMVTAVAARAQQFWFSVEDPVTAKAGGFPQPMAYMDLFKPDAPWSDAAARLDVFKFPAQFIVQGTDAEILQVFNDMTRRHVKLAVEMGAVMNDNTTCGGGEGYMQSHIVEKVGSRLTRLHLTLDYMAMDEPMWLGHIRTEHNNRGVPDCHYSLAETVSRVAETIAKMRAYYPQLQVGWIDVVANRKQPGTDYKKVTAEYGEFARRFATMTGTPLAFFHCDIAWQDDWKPVVKLTAATMRAQGIPFGAIIGGTLDDKTDEAWVKTALKSLKTLDSSPDTHLDHIIVQSWQPRPTKFLPETDPGTAAYLLLHAELMVPPSK